MAKITVKHYLNTRLKPLLVGEVVKYPVYVSANYKGHDHKFKSIWIKNRLSETEFQDNKTIKELIEYEKNIINEIVIFEREVVNIDFNLHLFHSTFSIVNLFLRGSLITEMIEQLLKFIEDKTGLDLEFIELNINFKSVKFWVNSMNSNIYKKETQTKIRYYFMLLMFEDNFFTPSENNELIVGKVLNFYEWKKNGAREKFIKFATEKDFSSNSDLISLTQTHDNMINKWIIDGYTI